MKKPWNHNLHYHPLVLAAVPEGCKRALDIGCGHGRLTRALAGRCGTIVGIDSDADVIAEAAALAVENSHVEWIAGDALSYPFAEASFDFIAAVASLHHLPLADALRRFRSLLAPGGVFAVIGLYRSQTLGDRLLDTAGLAASRAVRMRRGYFDQSAPMQEPGTTLQQVRALAFDILPGAVVTRHLYFRYSLTWQKPPR